MTAHPHRTHDGRSGRPPTDPVSLDGVPDDELLTYVLKHPGIRDLAARMPANQKHEPGRPQSYPPFVFVVYAAMRWRYGSFRATGRELAHLPRWARIRNAALQTCSADDYPGLSRHDTPVQWAHFRRYREKFMPADEAELADALSGATGNDDRAAAREAFMDGARHLAADAAVSIGLFDGSGGLAAPQPSQFVYGDGVVLPLRTKKWRKGDEFVTVDPRTGEIRTKPRRADPDACNIMGVDGTWQAGTKFCDIGARGAYKNEFVWLDFRPVPHRSAKAASEADAAAQAAEAGRKLPKARLDAVREDRQAGEMAVGTDMIHGLPDRFHGNVRGVVWDMAARGRFFDEMYKIGIVPVAKVARVSHPGTNETVKKLRIVGKDGMHPARKGRHAEDVKLRSYDGWRQMEVACPDEADPYRTAWVTLVPGKPERRLRKGSGEWAWYAEDTVPDIDSNRPHARGDDALPPDDADAGVTDVRALVPARLRGATVIVRLSGNREDRGIGYNRADHLRAFPVGSPGYCSVQPLRAFNEAAHNQAKSQMVVGKHRVAPSYGLKRQHFDLMGLVICQAMRAELIFKRRKRIEAERREWGLEPSLPPTNRGKPPRVAVERPKKAAPHRGKPPPTAVGRRKKAVA